jgi:hypothetical protein
MSSWSVAQAVHQPQARPDLVDRADLVVHERRRQAELADDRLADVGLHARGALRPGDPEAAGRPQRNAQRRQPTLELRALPVEGDDHVELPTQASPHRHPFRELSERRLKPPGCADQPQPRPRLDPQFADQRRSRISGRPRRHRPRARAAVSAITFDSWLPCHAIGDRPGSSVISRAPGIAAA